MIEKRFLNDPSWCVHCSSFFFFFFPRILFLQLLPLLYSLSLWVSWHKYHYIKEAFQSVLDKQLQSSTTVLPICLGCCLQHLLTPAIYLLGFTYYVRKDFVHCCIFRFRTLKQNFLHVVSLLINSPTN